LPVDFLRPYAGYAGGGTAAAQSGLSRHANHHDASRLPAVADHPNAFHQVAGWWRHRSGARIGETDELGLKVVKDRV
jgi:hypothetical protein